LILKKPSNVLHRGCIFVVGFTTPVLGANYMAKTPKNASMSGMELLFNRIMQLLFHPGNKKSSYESRIFL
jgi:hypothetical protein